MLCTRSPVISIKCGKSVAFYPSVSPERNEPRLTHGGLGFGRLSLPGPPRGRLQRAAWDQYRFRIGWRCKATRGPLVALSCGRAPGPRKAPGDPVNLASQLRGARGKKSFKASRLRLEFELARIVANNTDIGLREPGTRFGLDLKRQLHLGARVALKLHDDRVQDRVE